MGHRLTKSTKSEIPSDIIFFDTESRVDINITNDDIQRTMSGDKVEKDHELYLICACYCKRQKSGEYSEQWRDYFPQADGDTSFMDHFWNDVDAYVKKKKRCFLIAHNASYDVIASGCIPSLVARGYTVEAFSDSNPFFLKLAKYTDGVREKSLMIVSSTNYYQFSLAKLGECFGIPKTEIDYGEADIKAAIPYCRNDVQILKTAMLGFIKFIQEEDLGSFALTIAGQSMRAYRTRFLKDDTIYIHKDKKSLILEREAYAGGRNEAWRIGQINDHIYYLDVNSMYPSVMKYQKFPVKLITHRSRGKLRELQQFIIDKGYLAIAKVKLKAKDPIYFKKAGKLIFPIGEFVTTLSTPELIRAIADESIETVYKYNLYEGDYIFRDYVDYFYNKRLEAKANKDDVRTLLFKLFLNSLYGKFGQKSVNWERIDDADPEIVRTETIYNAATGKRITYKIFGGGRFIKVEKPDGENESYNSFPAIAAHVTAYARMMLWKYIETAGADNVYYMDTDSLFVNRAGYENLLAAGFIDDKKLGLLKVEEEADEMYINGCKDYIFNDHHKIKGISKSSVKIDDSKYISTIWRGLSKFIKSGDLSHYKNEMIIKTLSRQYDKGIIDLDGTVTPYRYDKDQNIFEQEIREKEDQLRAQISELKAYSKLYKRDPAIDIVIRLGGLKPDTNGAYRQELSDFKYPYRNFKNGTTIDRAVHIINGELMTEYSANDLIELIYDHTHQKGYTELIRNLERELNQIRVPDYYKKSSSIIDDLPF